jgi:hypothetical protein
MDRELLYSDQLSSFGIMALAEPETAATNGPGGKQQRCSRSR